MTSLISQFLLALFGTLGFSLIFRVPTKNIPACIAIGGLGWITYLISVFYFNSPVLGCFLGACIVGLCSTLAARIFKDASTIFVIPGILCLVPGAKIFYTMEAMLKSDFNEMLQIGIDTLLMAGAIAMGLLAMGTFTNIARMIIRKTISITEKIQ